MKKIFAVFLCMIMCFALFSCGGGKVDYKDVESFEAALDAGEDLTGKTVTFTVKEIVPDSAFGYNLHAGEKLNFCSSKNPNVEVGDTVTVKVKSVNSILMHYVISYTMK
ncbi:MAG: hypothetical protein NC244_05565 [Alistipes senegalensis]|nr:hypothetical protein [Alistipes senegalensis]